MDQMIMFAILVFIVAPIIKIVDMYLKKRWNEDLLNFAVAKEVIAIYRKHKKDNNKPDLTERFKNWVRKIVDQRKQNKEEKVKYGI